MFYKSPMSQGAQGLSKARPYGSLPLLSGGRQSFRDPLNQKGSASLEKEQHRLEGKHVGDQLAYLRFSYMTAAQLGIFVGTVLLFVWLYHYHDSLVLSLCCAQSAFYFFLLNNFVKERGENHKKRFFVLCMIVPFIAALAGMYIYYNNLVYYYIYRDFSIYTNIAASQHAEQFEDAGMLQFTSDSQIDSTRAVGFQSVALRSTVCIAPIVQGSMSNTDEVTFFAVGTNCCSFRQAFKCDDADEDGARSALLVLPPSKLVSPATAWFVTDTALEEGYQKAMKMMQAQFAVNAAEHVRLVRWVKDPMEKRDEYWTNAMYQLLGLSLAYAFVAAVCGLMAAYGPSRALRIFRFK